MDDKTYQFVINSAGDSSVGIPDVEGKVTIIFHDSLAMCLEDEDIDSLKKYLGELFDGSCIALKEWEEEREKEEKLSEECPFCGMGDEPLESNGVCEPCNTEIRSREE